MEGYECHPYTGELEGCSLWWRDLSQSIRVHSVTAQGNEVTKANLQLGGCCRRYDDLNNNF